MNVCVVCVRARVVFVQRPSRNVCVLHRGRMCVLCTVVTYKWNGSCVYVFFILGPPRTRTEVFVEAWVYGFLLV